MGFMTTVSQIEALPETTEPLSSLEFPQRKPGIPAETGDRPAYNSRLIKVWIDYLERNYPKISIDSLLKHAGMTRFEVEDLGHWFNQKQVDKFYEYVLQESGDQQIARKAGRQLALSSNVGPIRQTALGMLSLRSVYALSSQLSARFTTASSVTSRYINKNKIEIINSQNDGFNEKPYQCENRLGVYESLGKLFTEEFTTVEHPECIHRGDRHCRYIITWRSPSWSPWARLRNIMALLGIPALAPFFLISRPDSLGKFLFGWIALCISISWITEFLKAREYRKTIVTQGDAAKEHIESIRILYDNAILIQEIGRNVAKLSIEENLIEEIVHILDKRSDYHRCIVMLADNEKKYLKFQSGYGYDQETEALLEKTKFNLENPHSKGIFVRAFHEQRPLLIDDIEQLIDKHSKKSQEFARQLGGKDLICAPIAYEKQILGIISVDRTRSKRPLSQSDVSLLLGIASQLAVGLTNTRAYAQLLSSEKKYRDLVENAHSIILRMDPAGRIIFFNKFAQKLFGYSESQVYGKSISEVLSPTSPDAQNWIDTLSEVVLPNNDIPMVEETSYLLESGRTIWIAWTYRSIFSEEGELIEILCIGNDITQLKQTIEENAKLEIQLIRAQKMEALGTLAGGVAHDLNNVLAGVINYPELMLMRLPEDSPLRRYATSIQKSGERAAAIVQDLLTLARRNVVQVEVIDLNAVVADYIGSPEFDRLRLNHPLAKVASRLNEHSSGILGSPVQLSKAVMNLVNNAVEALEGKPGEVTVITENCHLANPLDAYEHIPAGDYVRLTVADTGCGMAADDLRRIFEPFFSRKKMGRSGTGLGMAVVWGTIKDHGGLIDIHSTPGRGTRFDIYFPPTTKVEKKAEVTPVAVYRGKGEKILVVDDEETQREIAHEILTDLGYDIKSVPSGEAAIETLRDQPVDLVVLDMIMASGMDGLDTYRQIVHRWPGQRAIIASGFSDNQKVHTAMKLGVGQYVKKPYNREALGKAVRQELDRIDEPVA